MKVILDFTDEDPRYRTFEQIGFTLYWEHTATQMYGLFKAIMQVMEFDDQIINDVLNEE